MSAAAATAPAGDPRVEEVRIAMALNGGVSLAVWMGGCAVELDCARRAHLGPDDLALTVPGAPPAPPARTTYHALCSAFGRELLIDIMSGASAGGINGALLAAAMTSQRRLHPDYLRARWIELGDFANILRPLSEVDPRSLMDGDLFHRELRTTFADVLGESTDPDRNRWCAAPPGLLPEPLHPALIVTTTNVLGEPRTFVDQWGQSLEAREHRACFEFHEPADLTADNLAAAARSSASYPLAFEPFLVEGDDPERLAGFSQRRWVLDGGLLDNAPIRKAIDLIPTRVPYRQAQRVVCYLNADPPGVLDEAMPAAEPAVRSVVGAVVGLPRKAPFADQLAAVEAAVQASSVAWATELALLGMDLPSLQQTARALLPAYRRERRLRALQDLLPQPGDAQRVFARIPEGSELPWIPTSIAPPPPGTWRLGINGAARVHHLMLDLLRQAIVDGPWSDEKQALLDARVAIEAQVTTVASMQAAFEQSDLVRDALVEMITTDKVAADMAALAGRSAPYEADLYAGIRATAEAMFATSSRLSVLTIEGEESTAVPVGLALFGDDWIDSEGGLTDAMFEHFLARVTAVEVVRRASSAEHAVVTGQAMAFGQLTPDAPALVLAARPVTAAPVTSANDKLTGVSINHFGGFYRSSWRANDFMWGRLDAAARIVDMLVGKARALQVASGTVPAQPWDELAAALMAGGETQEWLVGEALDDAGVPAAPDRQQRLADALYADLQDGDGTLTRVVCIRAAQLEVLRHELPILVDQAAADRTLGSSLSALDLGTADELRTEAGLRAAIESLRGGDTLPERLGRGSAELTTNLAIRTMSKAGLVGVAMARTAGAPLAVPIAARAFLLPVAGVVARGLWSRVAVVAAFWAAALFLTARLVSTDPQRPADLARLQKVAAVDALIALVVVIGALSVPLLRAFRGPKRNRWLEWLAWVALAATGGVAPLLLMTVGTPLTPAKALVGNGHAPVPAVVSAVLLALLGGSLAIGVPFVRRRVQKWISGTWGKRQGAVALALAGAVSGWSLYEIFFAGDHAHGRGLAAGIVATAALPVAALYVFLRR